MTNERPTPETDAEIEGIRNSIKKEYQFDWAIEVARKLERDRDEAREALRMLAEHREKEMQKLIEERDSAREIYKTLHSLYADEIVKNRKLEQERDETRNKMADALQEVDLRTLDFERMKQERDELLQWKKETLLVESQWDEQAVGRLLGLQLGDFIKANIEPKLLQLIKERDEAMAERDRYKRQWEESRMETVESAK